MRLMELEPRWLTRGNNIVGMHFKLPPGKPGYSCVMFVGATHEEQWELWKAAKLDADVIEQTHGSKEGFGWKVDCLDFTNMTLEPSIHIVGFWHVRITKGEIKDC